jgi:hypothetical protein
MGRVSRRSRQRAHRQGITGREVGRCSSARPIDALWGVDRLSRDRGRERLYRILQCALERVHVVNIENGDDAATRRMLRGLLNFSGAAEFAQPCRFARGSGNSTVLMLRNRCDKREHRPVGRGCPAIAHVSEHWNHIRGRGPADGTDRWRDRKRRKLMRCKGIEAVLGRSSS